ncbi:transposase [Actinomyces respiraculi]|uniref:Transposase n=1 Tax=Actinomyces respiraculi TaxID=2744574 RepID=A0A7T0LL72_9ACTO|nr:transposase [Actinomyces respiraculi]
MSQQQRKRYTPEFRREAARLVIESECPIARVAAEIDVSAGLLCWWVEAERERAGLDDGLSRAELRAENARLRRELAESRMDNEFLPKAPPSSPRSNEGGKVRANAAGGCVRRTQVCAPRPGEAVV